MADSVRSSVPTFIGRDYDFDARLGIRVLKPRIYIVGGYMWRGNNYGYPQENGAGVGLEKLPDLDRVFSFYGSALYYFGVNGNYSSVRREPATVRRPTPMHVQRRYDVLKYDIGVSYTFPGFPLFIEAGFLGDRGWNLQRRSDRILRERPVRRHRSEDLSFSPGTNRKPLHLQGLSF